MLHAALAVLGFFLGAFLVRYGVRRVRAHVRQRRAREAALEQVVHGLKREQGTLEAGVRAVARDQVVADRRIAMVLRGHQSLEGLVCALAQRLNDTEGAVQLLARFSSEHKAARIRAEREIRRLDDEIGARKPPG